MAADRGVAADRRRLMLTEPRDVRVVADVLALGGVVAHGFGNHYVFTARPDAEMMGRLNLLTGRPRELPASMLTTPRDIGWAFDWTRLPNNLTRRGIQRLVEGLGALGPFGVRCPAAQQIPAHLITRHSGIRTAVVVAPGRDCPSTAFVARALDAIDHEYLCSVPAGRSSSDANHTPPHWRASELWTEFGAEPDLVVLEHPDDRVSGATYPGRTPTAVSVLNLHVTAGVDSLGRPRLLVERLGSIGVTDLRRLVEELGCSLALAAGVSR